MHHVSKPRLVVILGPTASGKSALAVRIAKKYSGEIISADSRQVYRGLDIGTAKVKRDKRQVTGDKYFSQGVRHHLLDVASPRRAFSVARYQVLAKRAIRDILRCGKTPIMCGGTGQYIDATLGSAPLPDVPPNPRLRARLEKLPATELFKRLQKLDPARAASIDRHNPRRLVRALEIVMITGKPVPKNSGRQATSDKDHYVLIRTDGSREEIPILKLGLALSPTELRRRINARLAHDLRRGLIAETKKLHTPPAGRGLSWKRLDELGLEYRYVAKFLRGEITTKRELEEKLRTELWRYAKRQMTWFRRDKSIIWLRESDRALLLLRGFPSSAV